MSGTSDVDLVVIHALGDERAALDIRRTLVAEVGALGVDADVTLLSDREVTSTGFWGEENTVDLSAAIRACDRSGSGTGKTPTV